MNTSKKGFTLVELLVVIAILAVLSVAVVLVLNPAELLKQSRDATRISDIASINSAVSLFTTDKAASALTATTGGYSVSAITAVTGIASTTNGGATTAIDGSGYVKVAFNTMSTGSPLPKLPQDPGEAANQSYYWNSNGTTYKIAAKMESNKYTSSTAAAAVDGGGASTCTGVASASCWYELFGAGGSAL